MTPNAINSSRVAYALTCWHTMRMRQLLVSHAAMSRSVVCDSSAVGFLHDTYANSSCHNKCYTLILKRPHTPVPRRKAIYKYVKRFRTTSSILHSTKHEEDVSQTGTRRSWSYTGDIYRKLYNWYLQQGACRRRPDANVWWQGLVSIQWMW